MEDRIEYFERKLADNPDNPTGLLALANEYQKAGRHEDEAAVLQRYVVAHEDDEGNAYARLGDVLSHLGRRDEAQAAYERGVRQAEKFGHDGMAEDLRLAIIPLGEQTERARASMRRRTRMRATTVTTTTLFRYAGPGAPPSG